MGYIIEKNVYLIQNKILKQISPIKTENICKIITFKVYSRCLLCQHSVTVTYYMQIAEIATDSFDGLSGEWQFDIILDCFISNVLTIDGWKRPSNCGSLEKNQPLGSIEKKWSIARDFPGKGGFKINRKCHTVFCNNQMSTWKPLQKTKSLTETMKTNDPSHICCIAKWEEKSMWSYVLKRRKYNKTKNV